MSDIVAVKIEGLISYHLPHTTGTSISLCGIDGDDPTLEQSIVSTPQGAKIDCLACARTWHVCNRFEKSDFIININGDTL